MEKDDLGLEVDDDVAQILRDPKGPVLLKVLDYRDARKAKQAELDSEKVKKEKPDKLFGIF